MEKETLMNRSETTLDNHALIHFEMRLSHVAAPETRKN